MKYVFKELLRESGYTIKSIDISYGWDDTFDQKSNLSILPETRCGFLYRARISSKRSIRVMLISSDRDY